MVLALASLVKGKGGCHVAAGALAGGPHAGSLGPVPGWLPVLYKRVVVSLYFFPICDVT